MMMTDTIKQILQEFEHEQKALEQDLVNYRDNEPYLRLVKSRIKIVANYIEELNKITILNGK
jgi:hypothetical protein